MGCPDTQKHNQHLRKQFSNALCSTLFQYSDVTYGNINSLTFTLKQTIRRLLKKLYLGLPYNVISYIQQHKRLKKDPLTSRTAQLLNLYIEKLNNHPQELLNTHYYKSRNS